VSFLYPQLHDAFARLLDACAGRRVVVVGHARPDGDCIGSQVAVARLLRARGVDAVCCNPDSVPRRLGFLVPAELPFIPLETALAEQRAAIFVDCADRNRAGAKFAEAFPRPFGNIDHHLSNPNYAEHNLVDTPSAATAEILAGLAQDAGLPLDPVIAMALYTGIATDTGQFRFAATTERTFRLAATLVAAGADPARMGLELYETESFGKIQLLQRFLASLETCATGRVCIGFLPEGIYEQTGTNIEDAEGLVDYARSIEGVEVGALVEVRQGAIKASLRAKHADYRVDLIAAQFNGGGHACAAGLNVKGETMETFVPRLRAALIAQVEAVQVARASRP
jgi:bifunctional oligoribonuclease and PAP phosphatase NrnA